jgi:hypothetical protein
MNEIIIIGKVFLICSWVLPFLISDKHERFRMGIILSASSLIMFLIGYLIK